MEDIGQLVYLLLIVVFMILNALFGKKKKQQRQERPQPQKEEKSFEEVLEEMFGDRKDRPREEQTPPVHPNARPVKPVESQRPKAKRAKQQQQPTYVNVYQEYMENQKGKAQQKRIEQQDPLQLEDIDGTPSIDIDFANLDMRKAVIYKAILDRKHF